MAITKFTIQKWDYSKNWDVSELAIKIKKQEDADFSAGSLEFSLTEVDEGFTPSNGDIVEFQWDGNKTFKGKIFKVGYDSKERFECLAYDSLYYLKSEDTLVFGVTTAQERFTRIMKIIDKPFKIFGDVQITKLPAEVFDGETYFSMIKKSLESIWKMTETRFIIRDDYGVIGWYRSYGRWQSSVTVSGLLLGDGSLVSEWELNRSVEDLYNVIKVVREDGDDKERKTYTTKTVNSQASIERYGRMQKHEKADNDANDAQMQNQGVQSLNENNKEQRVLKVTAVLDLRIRAGSIFSIFVQSLNDIGIGQKQVFAKSVTHDFGANTMTIEGEII